MAKKQISRLTRKLRAKEWEINIHKALEELEQQANSREEFLESLKELLFKIFRLDFCFFVFKEKKSFQVKNMEYPFDYDPNLFIEIAQNIIKSKHPLIINSTKKHLRLRNHKLKSLLAAGIKTEDFEGAIILGGKRRKNFFKIDGWKIFVLTKELANSLNQIKLKEELKNKNKELEIIGKIDYLRDTISDQDKLINAVLEEIKKEIECEICYFYLQEKKDKLFVVGKSPESNFIKKNKDSLIELAEETIDESKLKKFSYPQPDFRNALCIPLMLSEGSPGAICLLNAQITDERIQILKTIAKQLNYALVEVW